MMTGDSSGMLLELSAPPMSLFFRMESGSIGPSFRLASSRTSSPPLPKILSIDTKNEAKKHLLSFSNSLKYLAAQFTDQEKMENDGWDLWVRVHSRDAEAQDTMAAYCAQDIIATEALFEALKPYMTTLPNMNQFSLEGDLCPNCGMASLKKRGTSLKKEQTMQRFQCMSCAAWSQQPKRGAPRGQST